MAGKAKQRSDEAQRIPLAEWISAGVGLVVVVGMIGSLVLEALLSETYVPPAMEVQATRLTSTEGQHILEFRVVNRSPHTGAGVRVEGVLKAGGVEVETSETTLDYVPGNSQREGGLVFSADPRKGGLQLRVTGFEKP